MDRDQTSNTKNQVVTQLVVTNNKNASGQLEILN